MGLGRTRSVGVRGVEGFLVEVESDVASGLPAFTVSGRADAACAQAPDRVRAAAANSQHPIPARRITVNLSPASVLKVGSGFDLAIVVATLVAAREIPTGVVEDVVHIGELGLDGSVRPVRGLVPMVVAAAKAGVRHVVVPVANAREARLVAGVQVHPVARLDELVARYRALAKRRPVLEVPEPDAALVPDRPPPDLADVVGQTEGRLAVEIAAAGAHHLYLVGPPGAGKSMLAERLPGLLPELDDQQAMEVTAISSILGTLTSFDGLCRRPPFVAPHHGASMPAIIGGGSGLVLPGAVTQAHHGVLFLDEAPEFRPGVMQALRQPIESGHVVVARAIGNVRFPCEFQLVLAANPCPCGMGSGKAAACSCSPIQQRRYSGRLSGPILDRIDIQVHVPAPSRAALLGEPGESTEVVRARVEAARGTQRERWSGRPYAVNGRVPGPVLRSEAFRLGSGRTADLDRAVDRGLLSLRGYDRCLRLAWTIADLAGRISPSRDDVGLALSLRHQPALAA
ncbi:MAG: YifB family Mg chelatase-like AAA ATPase [Actinomycetales bacterium]|jgi:magnesium chelatase family protein|nr:YifB family Mg chelatase-like AAA ATPase [Candidatus Phosphoribacter baldrii]MBK6955346.1 YifB family Mg chelatase-like AAA ATPase [Candidatus Phosphoribacter baldrii]MBK7610615.1 YifB family Mg chelatase-like AAA ATPase [Candidatus Phosphoribacter baldrii]HRC12223.1 YifB family Mg chelatase-like AAA ATPase [Dermatophilaceae bacterium]